MGEAGQPVLWVLPPEVLVHILSFLDIPSLLKTSLTCSYLNDLTSAIQIWTKLVSRYLDEEELVSLLKDLAKLLPQEQDQKGDRYDSDDEEDIIKVHTKNIRTTNTATMLQPHQKKLRNTGHVFEYLDLLPLNNLKEYLADESKNQEISAHYFLYSSNQMTQSTTSRT